MKFIAVTAEEREIQMRKLLLHIETSTRQNQTQELLRVELLIKLEIPHNNIETSTYTFKRLHLKHSRYSLINYNSVIQTVKSKLLRM